MKTIVLLAGSVHGFVMRCLVADERLVTFCRDGNLWAPGAISFRSSDFNFKLITLLGPQSSYLELRSETPSKRKTKTTDFVTLSQKTVLLLNYVSLLSQKSGTKKI